MGGWSLEYSDRAFADLSVLDRPVRRYILDRLEWFAEHFDAIAREPLRGEWAGLFKVRAGDWRIIYTFNVSSRTIKVRYVDHRSKIYKRRR